MRAPTSPHPIAEQISTRKPLQSLTGYRLASGLARRRLDGRGARSHRRRRGRSDIGRHQARFDACRRRSGPAGAEGHALGFDQRLRRESQRRAACLQLAILIAGRAETGRQPEGATLEHFRLA